MPSKKIALFLFSTFLLQAQTCLVVPGQTAGGDLAGTYPSPSVARINGIAAYTNINGTPIMIACDNSTDVGAQINAAFAASTSSSFYVPDQAGTCAVKTVISITRPMRLSLGKLNLSCQMANPGQNSGCIRNTSSNVSITGSGMGNTILTMPAAQNIETLLGIGNGTNVISVSGMTIDGNEAAQTSTTNYFAGLVGFSNSDVRIFDMEFMRAGYRAIDLRATHRSWTHDNYIHTTGEQVGGRARGSSNCGNAISIDAGAGGVPIDTWIYNNWVEDQGDSVAGKGIRTHINGNTILGSHYIGLTPCISESGIDVTGATDAEVAGNQIYDIRLSPIDAMNNNFSIFAPNLTITNGGTPATTPYVYIVNAMSGASGTGTAVDGHVGETLTGAVTLTGTDFNTVTWATMSGTFASYAVYRVEGGATQGFIGFVPAGTLTMNDTGLAGNGASPQAYLTPERHVRIHDNYLWGSSANAGGAAEMGDAALQWMPQDLDFHDNTLDGVYLSLQGGKGSRVHGNSFRNIPTWVSNYAISMAGSASGLFDWDVSGNTFYCNIGGATSGVNVGNSVGIANSSQFAGNIYVGCNHGVQYQASSTADPTIAANANAGTGASATITPFSNFAGTLTLVTGTGALTAGTLGTVTFSGTMSPTPICTLTPSGTNASALSGSQAIRADGETGSLFNLTAGSTAGLAVSTTYAYKYVCRVQ